MVGLANFGFAQVGSGLPGVVSDASGAPVPGAQVTVSNDTSINKVVTATETGAYLLNGLTPGKYTAKASFPGMQSQPATADVGETVTTPDITPRLVLEKQGVTVQGDAGPVVSTDPSRNAATVVLKEATLDALSEYPSRLILFGERPLSRALAEFSAHYHGERNHQGKGNQLLFPEAGDKPKQRGRTVACCHRLGGLLRYCVCSA